MANQKKRKNKAPRGQKTAEELLIERKAKEFLTAERAYWDQKRKLASQWSKLENLSLEFSPPPELSSTVFGLKDGVAFVRHASIHLKPQIAFRIVPITLEEWGQRGLVVPLKDGDLALAGAGFIRGLSNFVLMDCYFNQRHVPYVEFSHLKYGEQTKRPTIERAILDFQLTLMGLQAREASEPRNQVQMSATLARLHSLADEFEQLLGEAQREEEVQRYLKEHPYLLLPGGQVIPKQKLGEDFVTDFVLVSTSISGPTYTLVEIERPSHQLLTKDLSLSAPVAHALKQTRDWDIWLESNKAYLAGKLPGFETPKYRIVIGRGTMFGEQEKAHLRSYNRSWGNIELLTYDDILLRFRELITAMEAAEASTTSPSN